MIGRFKNFVEKRLKFIKLLFVFSVLIFVVYEIGRIFKQIEWGKVQEGLENQSMLTIAVMFFVGLIAVLPMIAYDFTIVKFLPGKYSVPYIFKSGWIVNTTTNVAGFGGVIGATLRANFYKKNASAKQIVYALSKIALFVLAGLSIYCWISLALIYGRGMGKLFGSYWIWLVGGGVYFPVLFIATKFKQTEFFADLTLKRELALIISSFFEWTFAGGFFLFIGLMMGIKTDFLTILAMYITGSVLGIVSMVPGGLGSFDVFMMYGMATLGVSNETAVVWIMFFRLFYYIIPFVIGVILFVHETGSNINEKLNGIPKMAVQKVAHFVLTIFLYASGILMLLEAAVPRFANSNELLRKLYSYSFLFISQVSDIIFAFMLLGLARGISAKVKRAYWPTLIVLAIGVINTLLNRYSLSLAIFLGFVMILVFLSKNELYRKQMQYSIGKMVADIAIFAGTFLLYTLVGILNTPSFSNRHHVPEYLLFPAQKVWFAGFIGLMAAALIFLLMLTYLSKGLTPFVPQVFDERRIKQIISRFGCGNAGHLVYLRDKSLYFFKSEGKDQVFFMYRRKQEKLFCIGEPIGNPKYFKEALEDFLKTADLYGFEPVFYDIDQDFTLLLHEYGYDFLQIGEKGLVDLEKFNLHGEKHHNQRALINRFANDGYVLDFLKPPYSEELLSEMRKVSDDWLSNRTEKGFSVGFFDEYYLEQGSLMTLRDSSGKLKAFSSIMPRKHGVVSTDLMRYVKDAPAQTMARLSLFLFENAKEAGYAYVDLGMAPTRDGADLNREFITEKTARYIYEYGYHFYSFQGLKAYKNKYVDIWKKSFIAYRKRSQIAFTMFQLMSVINSKAIKHDYKGLVKPRIFN